MDSKLKFRVWEPLNKKMYYMKLALYQGAQQKTFALPQEEQSLKDAYSDMNLDAVIIMQCSGLSAVKSYRGDEPDDKLLYDGDIVYIADWKCYSVVYWYHGSWFLKFYDCDEYLYENAGMCEIVGTIQEHPELLKR